MLKIDFNQSLNDHRTILILVKPIGYIGEKTFSKAFQEICQYSHAQVPNSTRTLHLKYSQQISPQFIEWSSFHSHRRVLGLICVAKCTDPKETDKLVGKINDLKSQFDSTLLDSRCFVFGCKPEDDAKVRKDFVIINEQDTQGEVERNMAEFVASLFNVLESKRISKLSEKPDKVAIIYAPVELDPHNAGEDSRSYKRKCMGRSRKYLGDLSMLTGLHQDALCQYSMATEHLRTVNDFLWLAGAIEGQCASSVAVNSSGTNSRSKFLILPTDCAAKTANMTSSNGFGNDIDETKFRNFTPLSYEEICEKLAEALNIYGHINGASVVEVEAHLKLVRILLSQKRTVDVSTALQNAVSVNVPNISDQEKIQRYSSAAKLYTELGFHRKAAFFTRVAAMQCVSHSLPSQAWPASYSLLLQAIKGYNILLDPQDFVKGHPYGWPALQIRLLHELVFTARRLGDPSLAVRHMSFLLHTMQEYLTDSELSDLAGGLENLAKQCAGSLSSQSANKNDKLSAESFPAVSLSRMPLVRAFKVHPLPMHLKPVGRKKASVSDNTFKGPFIFSSLRRNPKETQKRNNTLWVQGELGQVSMEIYNTMPFELKVTKMALCIEGVEFEPFPACLNLPPNTGPHSVMLLGIPHGKGTLRIKGYTISVLGTESTCPLTKDNMLDKNDYPIVVDVAPFMPLLQVSTSLPKVRSAPTDLDIPQSAPLVTAVTLYAGQSKKGMITLENVGSSAIESIVINLGSDFGEGAHDIFLFDKDEVNSCLPLLPGKSSDITVQITGIYHAPSGIGSSDDLNYDPEAPWGLNGIIQFRYLGELDKQHLYRRVSMTIDVSVVPSLHCHNFELRAIPSEDHQCLLLFDADNKTSNDMELEYSVIPETAIFDQALNPDVTQKGTSEVLSIQGNDTKRVSIYLPRFHLPLDPENELPSFKERLRKYCQAVKDMVKLKWNLPACEVFGFGNIDSFRLNTKTLEVLKPEPIVFDVTINNEVYDKEKGFCVSLCTTVIINVKVTNNADLTYTRVLLSNEPYQDHANGYRANELNGKVAWLGDLSNRADILSPGESLHHSCSFMFFYTGDFFVQISCGATDNDQPHAPNTPGVSQDKATEQGVIDYRPNTHYWTFSPPVKITVKA